MEILNLFESALILRDKVLINRVLIFPVVAFLLSNLARFRVVHIQYFKVFIRYTTNSYLSHGCGLKVKNLIELSVITTRLPVNLNKMSDKLPQSIQNITFVEQMGSRFYSPLA